MILHGPKRPDLLKHEMLSDIFEATAARIPEKTALIFGESRLSYAQLDQRASLAAHHLIGLGLKPGVLVGLWLPRGVNLLVMQLAIAKTGAAWLPFDADTPVDRIHTCLEDAQAIGLLSCADFAEALTGFSFQVWTAETLSHALPTGTELQRRTSTEPNAPAYVIYTSGSTGKPKGIAINQGSICHFLRSENEVLGVREDDTVYQGFSVAFDMSFEEIWISYLVGATLWIAPKHLVSDPDALPQALSREKITVLHAVPTLLALFSEDVPGLRIINLGGEMCPESLVDRWDAPTRKIFNTYGPTEATVSASLAQLNRGKPVTIGTPLPNYGLMVLDNTLKLLPAGETGELCITGPGVAAGYLGRPDLTAEKFLPNPYATGDDDTRLYRTGDLARIDADGQIQCLGRTDDQVKIRGFRVELGEIEAVLSQQAGVGTAAVVVKAFAGVDQLVAYLVAEDSVAASTTELRASLRECLPPYMVPARYEWLNEMPRLTSGKIDRKALKALAFTDQASEEESDTPHSESEKALFDVLGRLFPGQALRLTADFFTDLGGHSLLAARLVSNLRADPRFAAITVHDIYQRRVLGSIAAVLDDYLGTAQIDNNSGIATTPWLRRICCGFAQAGAIPVLVALRMLSWLAPFFTYHYLTGGPDDSALIAVSSSLGVFLFAQFLTFVCAIAGKWLILGRIKAGRYPLWGFTYYRWWLADRMSDLPPKYLLSGSPLQSWYLRALGAKIGDEAVIGSVSIRAPDLLTIGDGVSIGSSVHLENVRAEHGELIVGPISLGKEAYVGSYAVLENDTVIEDFGYLDGLSSLSAGERVPQEQVWAGSPARFVREVDHSEYAPRRVIGNARAALELVGYLLGACAVASLFFMPVFPSFMLIDWIDTNWLNLFSHEMAWGWSGLLYFALTLPASALLVLTVILLSAGFRWLVLPKLEIGRWPVRSVVYFRKWLTNQIQESSLNVLHGIYATVYAPSWYRLLGATVGKGAEISTALGIVPDMLTLGEDSFIADGVMLGDEQIDRGWVTLRPTVIGKRSFVGNGAYIPDGTVLPEDVLIGVQSTVPANNIIRSGETWIGSPPMHLPARETISGFPEELTFRPSWKRRIGRGLVEGLRIVMPLSIVITAGYLTVLEIFPLVEKHGFGSAVLALGLAGLVYGIASFVVVCLSKWLFIGRYRPYASPMWTPFVWVSEAVTNLYESIAVPNFVNFLRGTPLLPPFMRLLGCKIGTGVYLDTTDITEFDCVSIGDYSEINGWAGPQTHLFEDRIMKIGRVSIGSGVTIGARCTILYGSTLEDGVHLGPLTLVMKGEMIPKGTAWGGSPARPRPRR